MASKYANMNTTILMAIFFLPTFPLGAVSGIINLSLTYWVDKYLILRRYCYPNGLSESLPLASFHIM